MVYELSIRIKTTIHLHQIRAAFDDELATFPGDDLEEIGCWYKEFDEAQVMVFSLFSCADDTGIDVLRLNTGTTILTKTASGSDGDIAVASMLLRVNPCFEPISKPSFNQSSSLYELLIQQPVPEQEVEIETFVQGTYLSKLRALGASVKCVFYTIQNSDSPGVVILLVWEDVQKRNNAWKVMQSDERLRLSFLMQSQRAGKPLFGKSESHLMKAVSEKSV